GTDKIISEGKDHSKDNRFIVAGVNGFYISPVYLNESGKLSILMASRIGENYSDHEGVVAIELSLKPLTELIEKENTLERIVYIVDSRGDVIAYPNYGWTLKRKNLSHIVSVRKVVGESSTAPGEFEVYDSVEGIRVFGVSARVPYLGWGVIIEEPYIYVFKPVFRMIHRIALVSLLLSLLIILLGIVVVRKKIKPLIDLHRYAEQVKEGNLDIEIEAKTGDEIEDLANAFKMMTKRLKEMYESLESQITVRSKELKEAQDKLIYTEKLTTIGKLASIVGHELRNPLSIIKNSVYYLNMFDIGKVSQDAKEQLDIIEKETDMSNQIISQILDFAREKEPKLAQANIHKVIKRALDNIEIPSNITVKMDLCQEDPHLMCDAVLMERVFQNILVNAVQAVPSGKGTVTIKTKRSEDSFAVQFEDTGSGISEEDLRNIFDPLYSTKARGTGLGLTFCKGVVERHDGRISVESVVDIGTTFIIELPLP
ncbi:ATP-binding protein, partial [Candidatus Auribacterota bacterium]